jgi:hypothetical protein
VRRTCAANQAAAHIVISFGVRLVEGRERATSGMYHTKYYRGKRK